MYEYTCILFILVRTVGNEYSFPGFDDLYDLGQLLL